LPRLQRSTLFPYTTLFRSRDKIRELQFEWEMVGGPENLNFESITITPSNNAPVAADVAYTIDEDEVLEGENVLDNVTDAEGDPLDRKSTRLNFSHVKISYA